MPTEIWTSGASGDWYAPGNWGATSVPGVGDTVIVAAGTAELISGVDPAADLTIFFGAPTVPGLSGGIPNSFIDTLNNDIGPNVSIADTTPGNVGVLQTVGLTTFSGVMSVSGSGAVLSIGVDAPRPVSVKASPNGAITSVETNPGNLGQFQNDGTIFIDNGAGMVVTPYNTLDFGHVSMSIGTVNLDNGTFVSTYVTVGPPQGGIGTSGTINLANGSQVFLQAATNIDLNFQDGNNDRVVFNTTNQVAQITNFSQGDSILQTPQSLFGSSTPYRNDGLQYNTVTHVLQIATGVGGTPYLDYTIDGGYSQPSFQATNDANGNLVITLACFAEGTRIATGHGEVAVEALSVGDLVATARRPGAPCRKVRWIGHRRIDLLAHPDPASVRPVRVRAGAFGPGRPRRDLLLSPDHAVFVRGVLIPVRYLVNGATIAPVSVAEVRYFHIELDTHDIVLAEGLPAESYLDTGNRAAFANGGTVAALHPDFARAAWEAGGCAPLVLGGPHLARARRRLLARARRLGHALTGDAGAALWQHGAVLPAERDGRVLRVRLGAGAGAVVLTSRTWVPSWTTPEGDDTRVLGVAVSRLWLDGREASLDSPALGAGWYPAEAGWRWTDGVAEIAVAGARELAVELAMGGAYWRDGEASLRAA